MSSDPPPEGPGEDLADLYETAPCGYISISFDRRIVKVNATLCLWLGRSSDDLVGESIHEILGFGGRIAFETHLAPLLRIQGHVDEIALDLLTADGTKLPTIANATEKRDDDGHHLFTRLTIFKAVDRRTFERSLIDARAKAEAESSALRETGLLREQFIAVLGHDLRNPLGALSAGVGLLQRKERLTDQGQLILREMTNSLERATALVDDLLDLARSSLGGSFPVDRDSAAPLTPVLEHVVAEIRRIAPERAIEATIRIEEPIYCDRARIGQLASNLLANALTHGAAERPITVEASTTGSSLIFTVTNGGEPIPPEVRERLFQPFFRDAARASRNGLGLGLYISSEIAKAHGGTLEVESDEARTSFTLTIPRGFEA